MKNFQRKNLLFSLCGLNCGLCPMNLNQYCPGCGGGEGNQSCPLAKCSMQHGNIEYCFQCGNYPCEKYEGADASDSFITHRNQKQDMKKFQEYGMERYSAEQRRKQILLHRLLETCNDGRKKTLFCTAVNLLELNDLERILSELDELAPDLTVKERAARAARFLQAAAEEKQIPLKLRRKK